MELSSTADFLAELCSACPGKGCGRDELLHSPQLCRRPCHRWWQRWPFLPWVLWVGWGGALSPHPHPHGAKCQSKGMRGTVWVVVPGRVTVEQDDSRNVERWGGWHHVGGRWGWGGQRWGSDTSNGLRNGVTELVLVPLEGGLG